MNNGSLLENRVLTLDQATPGTGPLGPSIDNRLSPRNDTYLNIDHNIRTKVDNNRKEIRCKLKRVSVDNGCNRINS